jgi:Zn-finger nucleic acid-binding protein
MKCPVCTTTDLLMSDRQGIEIDYCPQCRGVWLDRGELDKVIERSVVMPVQQPVDVPQPRYREPEQPSSHMKQGHDNHHGYKQQQGHEHYDRHKKKSLLSELFDF